MAIRSFLDLEVYKESFQLSLEVDNLLRIFPACEKFLLIDQSSRASRSIPAQIAEGYSKRTSIKEFRRFLTGALAESNEMINHLSFAKAKKYITPEKADDLINRYHIVGKKLSKLIQNWKNY